MYTIYRNISSKNEALCNTKNNINHKNSNHCVNDDFANTFLCGSDVVNDSCRQSRVLNQVITKENYPSLIFKRKQVKKNKISYS